MKHHISGIRTFDNRSITTGIVVINRVSIELTASPDDSMHIWSCLTQWIKDGQIKLKFNCTEQEAFMLGLVSTE